MLELSNVFYFKRISPIGGTEQFLYEIAKKYYKYDITVLYDECDEKQYERLAKFVRCVKRTRGLKVKCKKVFLNFNIDAIDDIEAEEYIFVSHANYIVLNKELGGYIPPIKHPKLTVFVAVSEFCKERLEQCGRDILGKEIDVFRSYNPLTLEKPKKVIHLLSACRLADKTKGGQRTKELIKALDKYAAEHDRQYTWTIFTNKMDNSLIDSENVYIREGRLDIRPFIADSDYVVQLSYDMETYCYTIQEALGYGVPVVTTPLTVMKEFNLTSNERIILDWDCENVDDVARQIFEKEVKPFAYKPPEDDWDKLLVKSKSTYKDDDKRIVTVRCITRYYDKQKERHIDITDKPFEVSFKRALELVNAAVCEII